jgi:hypothetical protein
VPIDIGSQHSRRFRTKLDDSSLVKLIRRFPTILTHILVDNIEPTLNWLHQKRLDLNEAQMGKLITKAPDILGLRIEDNLEPKLNWLQKRLNLNEAQMGKLITKAPTTLRMSISDSLEPKPNWLQTRLLLNEAQMEKLTSTAPNILGLSISDNLEAKLNWLQQRLHLNDAQVSKIVRRRLTIFGSSISNKFEPTLQWLQGRLSLDGDKLAKLVESQPVLLGLSIPTNLGPTLDFHKECIGVEGTNQLLARNPVLLMASLERRLKPRLEQLKRGGPVADAGSLYRMAVKTDVKWQNSIVFQTKKLGETLKTPQYRHSLDEDGPNNLIQQPPRILSFDSSDKLHPDLAFYISHVDNQKRLGNTNTSSLPKLTMGDVNWGPPDDKDWDAWIDHESAKLQTEDETYECIVQNTPDHVTAAHESFRKLLEGDESEWFNYSPMLGVRTEYYYRYSGGRR